jgi:hypothetical protein
MCPAFFVPFNYYFGSNIQTEGKFLPSHISLQVDAKIKIMKKKIV